MAWTWQTALFFALLIATPFFVIFGALSDRIGRKPIILAGCLIAALTYFPLFKALTQAGLALRPLLPATLKAKLPREVRPAKPRPTKQHSRRVLMLEGCVQPSLSPNTNAAAARVLDRLGISVSPAREAGCCGAVDYHLNAQEAGLDRARRNIDAWWPAIEAGAEAIVQTASGCGAFVKEYGHLLKDDPAYAAKAARVSELAKDLVEVLRTLERPLLGICVGMQLLFETSEEGDVAGLGLLPGRVSRLRGGPGLRVPHMGWSTLRATRADALVDGVDGAQAYFVHSFAAPVTDDCVLAGDHGEAFAAAVRRGRVAGTQFHPERSAAVGARVLRNFLSPAFEA